MESRIVEVDDFVFIAVRRFDRTESGGRVGVHSLAAIDGALYGEGSGSWAEMADRLHSDGRISASEREAIGQVWDFGRAIRNTDMLPTAYAPNAAGVPEVEPANAPTHAMRAESLASDFWARVSADPRIRRPFGNSQNGIGSYSPQAWLVQTLNWTPMAWVQGSVTSIRKKVARSPFNGVIHHNG